MEFSLWQLFDFNFWQSSHFKIWPRTCIPSHLYSKDWKGRLGRVYLQYGLSWWILVILRSMTIDYKDRFHHFLVKFRTHMIGSSPIRRDIWREIFMLYITINTVFYAPLFDGQSVIHLYQCLYIWTSIVTFLITDIGLHISIHMTNIHVCRYAALYTNIYIIYSAHFD